MARRRLDSLQIGHFLSRATSSCVPGRYRITHEEYLSSWLCLAFIQHDQIKEEIFKQNHLPFLIRCASQSDLHVGSVLQVSLEIIWALLFHEKIQNLIVHSHEEFLAYLRDTLAHSDEKGVQAAAKGILWQLESAKNLHEQTLLKSATNATHDTYDIMISYSHSNKELCYKIHQSLLQANFRVWLDFENMYGSTIQSMAIAIESSEMILVCMSNPYKQSVYCRSEAEYAYTRQRHIIPIVMENRYRPDGWLGLICASKMYVDFTKLEFPVAFERLMAQIQLFRQQQSAIQSVANISLQTEKQESLPHATKSSSMSQLGRSLSEKSSQHTERVYFVSFVCLFDPISTIASRKVEEMKLICSGFLLLEKRFQYPYKI